MRLFGVIFKHRASKDNFFHSCSSVHVPVSCSLSVVSLVSSQSRRDGDVCASINKSNWHLVAFTIIIITFKLFSFYLCTAGDTSCVSIEEARQRPSSSMVAFSRMSHINYSTGNFLTPVSFSLSLFQSYLSGGSISVEEATIDGRPPSQIFELTRLALLGWQEDVSCLQQSCIMSQKYWKGKIKVSCFPMFNVFPNVCWTIFIICISIIA